MTKKLVFLLLFLAAPALPAQDVAHIKLAGRNVALWKPSGPAPGTGYPIIVFSHGFGGCNTETSAIPISDPKVFSMLMLGMNAACGVKPHKRRPGPQLGSGHRSSAVRTVGVLEAKLFSLLLAR